MKYLQLIRYKNLLLIALMQTLFHFAFLKNQTNFIALSDLQFILLILATLSIAAAGYIINDIEDQYTDSINKPEKQTIGVSINEDFAFYIYIALTVLGVGIGYYLSNLVGKNSFVGYFIIVSLLLYMYSTTLKRIPVLGNIIIALILASSVLIIGFFDLFPAMYSENFTSQMYLFSVLVDFSIFTFIINFIREMLKDVEDINGDYNADIHTLPVLIGAKRTLKIILGITLIAILLVIYYISVNFINSTIILIYSLLFILGPLLYFFIKVLSAKNKTDYKKLSTILKLIMLFGILSIAVIQLNFSIHV